MPYLSGPSSPPTRSTARAVAQRYREEPSGLLDDLGSAGRGVEAYTAVAYAPEGPSATSRTVLLGLLGLLVGAQATWGYKHFSGTLGLSGLAAGEARPGSASTNASGEAAHHGKAVSPLKPSANLKVPRIPRLSLENLCVALALKDDKLELQLDDKRRKELVETLTRLETAEEQRWKAVDQMRASFTEEQAKEVVTLIQQRPYVDLTGNELVRESKKVLSKIANGVAPPFPINAPVGAAEKFDWDQSLRGALALEKTTKMMTSLEASQMLAAIPELDTANRNLRVWTAQLNSQLRLKELQHLYRFQEALSNRQPHVGGRTKGHTQAVRLIKAALATLQEAN